MREGDIVIITAKLPVGWTHIGTFIGHLKEKSVQVLLATGYIFTGKLHEIYLHEELKDVET